MRTSPEQRAALGVLALCTLMNTLSRGIGESFAIFLLPITREFGGDRAAITGVYSTFVLVVGLMSPLVGVAVDRLGARLCYGLGLALFASAYALAGSMTALWQMYLLIGVLSAVGSTLIGAVPASSLVSRWFGARLPTAMGALSAALGTGMLIVAPLVQALVEHSGWRSAYFTMGACLCGLLLPLLLLPWKRIAAGAPDVVAAAARRASAQVAWTTGRALRTPIFWALSGVMFFTSITTYTINVQLVACLVEAGFRPLEAATIFGLVGMLSIVGMLGAGLLAERFGERWVATMSYGATILGIGVLALASRYPSGLLIGAFVLLFGTMQGSRGPLVAVLAARNFPGAMGRVYGMVLVNVGVGAGIGSWASGTLYDLTGAYYAGFVLAAVCAVCGLGFFWTVRSLSGAAPLEPRI
ncbi:MAG: MFS transporter [Burkholderiaceae bacterium]|nr:MFS transporter [Burkholderiaceae bacterium]